MSAESRGPRVRPQPSRITGAGIAPLTVAESPLPQRFSGQSPFTTVPSELPVILGRTRRACGSYQWRRTLARAEWNSLRSAPQGGRQSQTGRGWPRERRRGRKHESARPAKIGYGAQGSAVARIDFDSGSWAAEPVGSPRDRADHHHLGMAGVLKHRAGRRHRRE